MTIVLSGGIGKHVAFSSLIPKIANKFGDVNIMSPWPDIFMDSPGVKRSINLNVEYGYEDYFKNQDRFAPEPYNSNDFFKKKIHVIESFARDFGLTYEPETDFASFISPDMGSKARIDQIASQGKYIVVQFMGGNQAMNGRPNDKIMVKDYYPELIDKVVTGIRERYRNEYQIVNYGLSFEWNIPNTISVGDLPYSAAPYLLSKCETFVAIDSSLQHFSACNGVRKSGVVLWGATSPVSFGYPHNINLAGECPTKDLHCSRPYFLPTSDIVSKGNVWSCKHRSCMAIPAEIVLENVHKIIERKKGK